MPSLSEYQHALAAAVIDIAPTEQDDPSLWGLSSAGIAMTGHVRRSWCMGRARRAAPLTLAALHHEEAEAILADWVAAGHGTGSFFESEAMDLIDFILERTWKGTHATSLACFERAVIHARNTAWDRTAIRQVRPADVVVRAFGADMVTLEAPIPDLLAAIERRAPWPELGRQAHRLLVAPGIEGLAREASDQETDFWDAARSGVFANRDLETANAMVECGALIVLEPPEA